MHGKPWPSRALATRPSVAAVVAVVASVAAVAVVASVGHSPLLASCSWCSYTQLAGVAPLLDTSVGDAQILADYISAFSPISVATDGRIANCAKDSSALCPAAPPPPAPSQPLAVYLKASDLPTTASSSAVGEVVSRWGLWRKAEGLGLQPLPDAAGLQPTCPACVACATPQAHHS